MLMSDTQTNCAYRYTVRRGDSFYLIAQRLNVQLRDLLEANPTIPPARLTIGDVLCIPYSNADTPAQECPACPAPNPEPETPAYTCPANRRSVVQNGQTASDLQLRYNLSWHTLKTANSDKDLDAPGRRHRVHPGGKHRLSPARLRDAGRRGNAAIPGGKIQRIRGRPAESQSLPRAAGF